MAANLEPDFEMRWRRATDDDVLQAAFPIGAGHSNAALACVYHEFVRRGLETPEDTQYVPHEERTSLREDFGAYVMAVILFSVLTFASLMMLSGLVGAANLGFVLETLVTIAVGVWTPLIVTLMAFRAFLLRRGARIRYTRCGVCGYILRGLTEPRCPECGERF